MAEGLRIVVDASSLVQRVERAGPTSETAAALAAEQTEALRRRLREKAPRRLPVGLLYQNVDREHYQRLLDEPKVQRIVRDFDPDALGVPLVCARADGSWWILDGQHRIEAVRRRFGVGEEVWCDVVPEREPQAEASLFRRVNTERSGLTALQSWHTDRMVGVRDVLDAERVLQQYGRRVGTGEREVRCAGAVREIVRPLKTGVDDLHWIMDVLLRAWGNHPDALGWAFRAVVMRGLHTFHARYRAEPDFNREHFIRRLSDLTPQAIAARMDGIRGRALERGETRGLRANPTQCFARALWGVYNERPAGGLLPLRGDRTHALPRRLPPWEGEPSPEEA